jgi:hypothetical protein
LADETTTDATNSAPATLTDASAETTTPTSTTGESNPNSEDQPGEPGADPLGDGGLLDGADEAAAGDGSDADGDAGDAQGDAASDASALLGAPDGDYELALPDDATFDIAKEDLDKLTPLAKEIGLSNAGLSRLATEAVPVVMDAVNRSMVADVIDTRKAWESDARAFVQGGKLTDGTEITASAIFAGENMDAVTTTAARAMDRFTKNADGTPIMFPAAKVGEDGQMVPGTFRDFLKTTGLGNHPGMVQFAYMAGKLLGEDSDFERGGDVAPTKLSREDKYYPARQQT